MNIAIMRFNSGIFGGIEHQVVHIAKAMLDQGHAIHLITDCSHSEMASRLSALGASVLSLSNMSSLATRVLAVRSYCRRENIHVLQSHMFRESIVARLVRFANPSVRHVFRVHTYIDCSYISSTKKNMYHCLARLSGHLVDRYLPINNYCAEELRRRSHAPKSLVTIIPDAITPPDAVDAIESRPWPFTAVAHVANFSQVKRHDILLNGLALLKSEGVFLHALLVGGEHAGEHRWTESAQQLTLDLGLDEMVTFAGYVDDWCSLTSGISVFVLPSDSEGSPNALLEAMAIGKIVIASRVGGIPEFIVDGQNGILHEPGSPHAFAHAVQRALAMDSAAMRAMSIEAMATVHSYFPGVVSASLDRIYREVRPDSCHFRRSPF
jgi:glycosyltransferase involved in cell wall biosynthesis